MSKMAKTVAGTLLIVMTTCGTAFAAPISNGKTFNGDYLYNGTDTMALGNGTEIEFFKDPVYGVFNNATKVLKTVQQGEPGNTIKYNINAVSDPNTPSKVHTVIRTGDNVIVNNIMKEGEYKNHRILYASGQVDIVFNTPYFKFQQIVGHESYTLDDNGNVTSDIIKTYYDENGKKVNRNDMGVTNMIREGEQEWKYSLTEPGLYFIRTDAVLDRGIGFYVCIDKYYDNGGQGAVVNDNKAVPSTLNVSVNGNWTTNVPVYTMNGNKYMKVRALGQLINGTSKQFNVYYNAGSKCTNLNQIENPVRGATSSYQAIGGELSAIPSTVIDNPQKTEGYFLIGSISQNISAFDVDGWTYIRLDHVAPLLGISISQSGNNLYITA